VARSTSALPSMGGALLAGLALLRRRRQRAARD
jgi:LPXTG-motif cell wall-anchored protein